MRVSLDDSEVLGVCGVRGVVANFATLKGKEGEVSVQ